MDGVITKRYLTEVGPPAGTSAKDYIYLGSTPRFISNDDDVFACHTIGVVAQVLHRSIGTVRRWERSRVLPWPLVRSDKGVQPRLYPIGLVRGLERIATDQRLEHWPNLDADQIRQFHIAADHLYERIFRELHGQQLFEDEQTSVRPWDDIVDGVRNAGFQTKNVVDANNRWVQKSPRVRTVWFGP